MNTFKPCPLDTLRVRRNIAIISFICILITLFSSLAMAFFGSPSVAANINAMQMLLTSIVGFLTGIVGAYYHNSHKASEKAPKEDEKHD